MIRNLLLGTGASALALAGAPVRAQDAPPAAPATPVAGLTVTALRGSPTQPSVARQRSEVLSTAGSVGFLDAEDLKGRYAVTLRDVLKDAPGVFVQARYGQELRLSVRGSGIGRGFHLRGIELLQDGVPWNLADGSGDFYGVDPLSLRSVEVFKGGSGLQYGAASLGGAINLVTPTALTAVAPDLLRLEAGSFSSVRASATAGRVSGDLDALATLTASTSAGSRQHSRSNDLWFTGNLGWRIAPGLETRTYVSISDTRQELPGTLTLGQALAFPDRAAAASADPVLGGNQQRNQSQQRIANRTSWRVGDGRVDLDAYAFRKHLDHPIFQVVHQDGWTWGGGLRYAGAFSLGGLRDEVLAGVRLRAGVNDAEQYANLASARGRRLADARQEARSYEAWVENRLFVLPQLAVTAALRRLVAVRELDNRLEPARSGAKTFSGLSPRFGLLWTPRPGVQLFADVSRSRDVPDFTDLAQPSTAGAGFVPLRQQTAWTYEAGARGGAGPLRFDVTLYRADLRGELLQFLVDPNIPAATFNAGRTRHQGVEASATLDVPRALGRGGGVDGLSLTALWNRNDFTFRGDRQYGSNRIAGTPGDVLRFEARWTRARLAGVRNAYLAPQLDWVPRGAWADQANTVRAPGYALAGVEAGFEPRRGLLLFLEGRNLSDAAYVSDIGPVTDLTRQGVPRTIFYPGDRRSVFAGARLAF